MVVSLLLLYLLVNELVNLFHHLEMLRQHFSLESISFCALEWLLYVTTLLISIKVDYLNECCQNLVYRFLSITLALLA